MLEQPEQFWNLGSSGRLSALAMLATLAALLGCGKRLQHIEPSCKHDVPNCNKFLLPSLHRITQHLLHAQFRYISSVTRHPSLCIHMRRPKSSATALVPDLLHCKRQPSAASVEICHDFGLCSTGAFTSNTCHRHNFEDAQYVVLVRVRIYIYICVCVCICVFCI